LVLLCRHDPTFRDEETLIAYRVEKGSDNLISKEAKKVSVVNLLVYSPKSSNLNFVDDRRGNSGNPGIGRNLVRPSDPSHIGYRQPL
jgi:hypothetical protein